MPHLVFGTYPNDAETILDNKSCVVFKYLIKSNAHNESLPEMLILILGGPQIIHNTAKLFEINQ